MSYDKPITNYRVKDDLKVGDPAKRVLGGELSKDFEAIAKAITDLENKSLLPNTDSDINFCGAVDATSTFHYPGGLRSVQGGDIYLTTTAGKAAPEWIGLDGAELNVGNAIGFSAVEGKWYLIGDIAGVEGQEGPQGEQGEQGEKGEDGEPGADGKDGVDGTDGVDGKDGVDGEKGDKGDKGEDGKDADSVEGFLKGVDEYEAPRDVPTNMVSWTTDDSYNTKSGVFNIRYEKKSFAPDYFVTFYGHFAQSNLTMGVHCEDDYGYSTQLAGPYGLAVTIASAQAQFLTPEIALGGDYGYCEDENAAVKLKRDGPSTFKHAVQAADFLDADGNSIVGAGGFEEAPIDAKYYGRKDGEWSYLSFDSKPANRRLGNICTSRLAPDGDGELPEYTDESVFVMGMEDDYGRKLEAGEMAGSIYLNYFKQISFNSLESTMVQLEVGDYIEFSNTGVENQCALMKITAADIKNVGSNYYPRFTGVFEFEIEGTDYWRHNLGMKEGLQYTFHAIKAGKSSGGDGIEEAPEDNKWYVRKNGDWLLAPSYTKAQIRRSTNAANAYNRTDNYNPNSVTIEFKLSGGPASKNVDEMAATITKWADHNTITFNELEFSLRHAEAGDYLTLGDINNAERTGVMLELTSADVTESNGRYSGVFGYKLIGERNDNETVAKNSNYSFMLQKQSGGGGGGEGFLKSVDEIEFDYNTEGPKGDVVSWSFNDTYNNVSSDFKITWGKRYYGPLRNVAEGHWIQSSPNGVGLHASKSDGSKESFYWANPAGYAQIYASTTTQIFSPSIALAAPNGGTADGEAAIKLKNNGTSTFKHAIKAADFLDRQGNSIIGAGGGLWTDDGKLGISYGEADGNQGNVNIYGEDRYKPQLCLQGPVGSTPSIWFRGASLGMMDNPLYCQVKASAAGHGNGQELQVWTVTDDEGGYGHQPFVFGSNGTFFIQPDRSTDAVNYDVTAGFRNDGGKLQFRHESGRWNDLTDLGGSTRSVSPTQLIETLSTLRDATQDETTVEGLRDAIGNAIGGIIEKFEAQIKTVREMSQ